MKPATRAILLTVAVVAVVAYLVVMSWVPVKVDQEARECRAIQVTIEDSALHRYITPAEVCRYLDDLHLNPVGSTVSAVELQPIEDTLIAHPLLANANCYIDANGVFCVELSQRVPLVRVDNARESYYVAEDRGIMPAVPSITTPVLQVRGALTHEMACGETADFAEWVRQSEYWKDKIMGLYLRPDGDVVMVLRNDACHVLLGSWQDYEKKLRRLQVFYENGYRQIDHPPYRELDVRFDGQVIGRPAANAPADSTSQS